CYQALALASFFTGAAAFAVFLAAAGFLVSAGFFAAAGAAVAAFSGFAAFAAFGFAPRSGFGFLPPPLATRSARSDTASSIVSDAGSFARGTVALTLLCVT